MYSFTHLHPTLRSIHVQIYNIVVLSHLVKTGGSLNKVLSNLGKDIQDYLLKKGTMITAEYVQETLNKETDFQSQTVKDASEWILNQTVF